ncbi:MAG: hypothetical protein ACU836_16090 [Gammaproteobacteria bacterium]
MSDFIFKIASGILQMNLKDPHDIPFALPLVMAAILGFVIGFILIHLIGNEKNIENDS